MGIFDWFQGATGRGGERRNTFHFNFKTPILVGDADLARAVTEAAAGGDMRGRVAGAERIRKALEGCVHGGAGTAAMTMWGDPGDGLLSLFLFPSLADPATMWTFGLDEESGNLRLFEMWWSADAAFRPFTPAEFERIQGLMWTGDYCTSWQASFAAAFASRDAPAGQTPMPDAAHVPRLSVSKVASARAFEGWDRRLGYTGAAVGHRSLTVKADNRGDVTAGIGVCSYVIGGGWSDAALDAMRMASRVLLASRHAWILTGDCQCHFVAVLAEKDDSDQSSSAMARAAAVVWAGVLVERHGALPNWVQAGSVAPLLTSQAEAAAADALARFSTWGPREHGWGDVEEHWPRSQSFLRHDAVTVQDAWASSAEQILWAMEVARRHF